MTHTHPDFSDDSQHEFLSELRNRPRRIIYTDSDSAQDPIRAPYPNTWQDRRLECRKYVDDCLPVEKVLYKGNEISVDGVIKVRAHKTQPYLRTVEYNLSLIHI